METKKNNFNLNEDCGIAGKVIRSCVSNPELLEGRPKPVYSVTIQPDEGVCYAVGLMYCNSLGEHVSNLDEIYNTFVHARELTFDSIQKPLTSGVGESGEFDPGATVRVSCRLEVVDGELDNDGFGQFKFPRLTLRFVDSEWIEEEQKPEPITPISDEVMALYDF